jgi:hypothetical protein
MTSRHWAALMVALVLLLTPSAALAAGKPTPTPVPTLKPSATVPPPGPTPLPPTATAVPATSTPIPPTLAPTATAVPAAEVSPETGAQPPADQPAPVPPDAPPAVVPPPEASPTPESLAEDTFSIWHGVVREGGAYRRSAPSSAATILEDLDPGTPIRVDRWVGGSMLYPDVITWGEVDPDDGGGYIFGGSLAGVLPPDVPPAPVSMQDYAGTWVDVNLTLNVVTAYEDGAPVKMMLTSPGRPGYETDTGNFSVRSRLFSQTMTGPGYDVPGVPHVQYFFGAEALHGRYWTLPGVMGQTSADVDDDGSIQVMDDPYADAGGANSGVAFGVPSSHGCLGLDLDSATWLYGITPLGTPVDVHF